MGKHGIGKCNSNGELLLALCSEFELIVTNTMFKQQDERKTTWMHHRSRHWHMIDFIIMRCRDKMDIHSTRARRGANCWTDHQMLSSKVAFRIRHKHNRQGTGKPTKLNTAKLSTISHRETVFSPNGRRRKTQNHTRNGQLCSRSYTTQPRHILASQTENTRTASTPTTRSYRLLFAEETKPTRVFESRNTRSTTAAYKYACRLLLVCIV